MFKKDTHSPWLDLAVFTVIVGFFLFSAARLVERNQVPVAPQNDALTVKKGSPISSETRIPASASKSAVAEVELPCLPSEKSVTTGAEFLRVSGTACGGGKLNITAGHGKNHTSGSEILCFIDRNRNRVSTNYFQLVPGLNRVELSLVWSNGTKRQSILEIQKLTE